MWTATRLTWVVVDPVADDVGQSYGPPKARRTQEKLAGVTNCSRVRAISQQCRP
jgi:hypothetical protein